MTWGSIADYHEHPKGDPSPEIVLVLRIIRDIYEEEGLVFGR
jgi:hypothetical protein